MATFTIVDKDKDPLGPNEINAGETISVSDGDVFIVDPSADDDIEFESASGSSTDFEIQINASNTNSFEIKIKESLNPEVTIADNVDLSDVKLDAKEADSLDLTIGDNVTLEELKGSEDGDDTIVIGDGFTTDKKIETKDGNDSITIGDNASLDSIDTGDGNNSIVIGNNATLKDIETGDGDDTIVIGDGLEADDIETNDGNDSITIGDGAEIDDLKTGKGDDEINLGNDFIGDKVEAGDGDDIVRIGTGADIDKLDGGKGIDTLASPEDYPDAKNFEVVVCFVRGTRIRTEHGEVPVEHLKVGDRVVTADHGNQPIRWIGASEVAAQGPLAPVRIKKGAYGNKRDLWISQQHRIQLSGWRFELLFGEPECLIPAKFLVNGDEVQLVEMEQVEYFHMLFDGHEVVYSEGIPTESFHPGDWSLSGLNQSARDEIFTIFPHLRGDTMTFGPSARPSLMPHEAGLLKKSLRAQHQSPSTRSIPARHSD